MEEWGPKAIGVRFKLSREGKLYLKELEAAAKYESKMTLLGLNVELLSNTRNGCNDPLFL
jgi:hypothetical protein